MNGQNQSLLFGLLAAQLFDLVRSEVDEAMHAWQKDPATGLRTHLIRAGALSEYSAHLVDTLLERAVEAHDGHVEDALAAFGGARRAQDVLLGVKREHAAATATVQMPRDTVPGYSWEMAREASTYERRYTELQEYARGGMGRIVLAYDSKLDRHIAVKELLPDDAAGAESPHTPVRYTAAVASRFLQEARLTGQLEHPAIVPVYELGEREDGSYYYTMKLVRGKTLQEVINRARTLRDRLDILPHFLALCQAIAYAHSRQVVHRDIKPTNVMIGDFGETVVLDWGVARSTKAELVPEEEPDFSSPGRTIDPNATPQTTKPGDIMGTPAYMSPEQARGDIAHVDELSDIYSLGAVLYELLTGKKLYEGNSSKEVLNKVIEGDFRPIRTVEPRAPRELVSICERALARRREDRWQTVQAIAMDVQRYMTGRLVEGHHYSAWELALRYYRRHRLQVASVAAALLIVLASGLASYNNVVQAREDERFQRQQAEDAWQAAERARKNEQEARLVAETRAFAGRVALAREQIARHRFREAQDTLALIEPDQRDWVWGHLMCASTEGTTSKAGFVEAFPSPTGDYAALVPRRGDVQLVSLPSLETVHTLASESPRNPVCAFSHDGTQLAVGAHDGVIRLWRVEDGSQVHTLQGHNGSVMQCGFIPNSPYLVTVAVDGMAFLWNADTGERVRALGDSTAKVTAATPAPAGDQVALEFDNRTTQVFDVGSGEAVFAPLDGAQPKYAPGGQCLLTVDGKAIRQYDTTSGKALATIENLPDRIVRASYARGGDWIIGITENSLLLQCDSETGTLIRQEELSTPAWKLMVSPDGKAALTAYKGGDVSLWDLEELQVTRRLNGHAYIVNSLSFMGDSGSILTAGGDEIVRFWSQDIAIDRRVAAGVHPPAASLAVGADGQVLAVLAMSGELALVDPRAMEAHHTLELPQSVMKFAQLVAPGQDNRPHALLLSPRDFAVMEHDGKGITPRPFGYDATMTTLERTVDGQLIAAGDWEGKVLFFNLETGKQYLGAGAYSSQVADLAFDRDGGKLAVARLHDPLQIIDAATGHELSAITLGDRKATAVTMAASAGHAYVGTRTGEILLVDTARGEVIKAMEGHQAAVLRLRSYDDPPRLLSVASDNTVFVWEQEHGERLVQLPATSEELAGNQGFVDAHYMESLDTLVLLEQSGNLAFYPCTPEQTAAGPPAQPEANKTAPPGKTRILTVIRSRDTVAAALTRVDEAGGKPANGGGLTLGAPLPCVGLRTADVVHRVNDTQVNSVAEFAAALAGALQEPGDISIDLELTRGGNPIHANLEVFEASVELINRELARDEALAELESVREPLLHALAEAHHMERSYKAPLSSLAQSASPGIPLVMPDDPALAAWYSDLGLDEGDRLASVNGTPVFSEKEVQEALLAWEEDVRNKAKDSSLELAFSRGIRQNKILAITVP